LWLIKWKQKAKIKSARTRKAAARGALGAKNILKNQHMKNILFSILFMMAVFQGNSQFGYGRITFDDTLNLDRIRIDTTIPNNIWQIGAPHKHIFVSSHTLPNAIITDTTNSYSINNNSVFYLKTPGDFPSKMHSATLNFWYMIDSDTLLDYGKIEMSVGSSPTWTNICKDYGGWIYDSIGNLVKQTGPNDTIGFTGISHGWYHFTYVKYFPDNEVIDSIRYRFTFHSSNIFASRDGWMIDDITFEDMWESVFNQTQEFKVYPIPVNDWLNVNSKQTVHEYEISDISGEVLERKTSDLSLFQINVSTLIPGFYFYKFKFISGQQCIGKFIKK
jgi:hypothetical protein